MTFIGQLLGAVILIGLGAVIVGASWPTTDAFDNESGSTGGVVIGSIVSLIGWCGFLIFAIAPGRPHRHPRRKREGGGPRIMTQSRVAVQRA